MRRLRVRARLTVAFAAVMVLLFAGLAVALYRSTQVALLDEIDTGLRYRAEALEADAARGPDLSQPTAGLVEPKEAFAQVATRAGRVVTSSPGLKVAILQPAEIARDNKEMFFTRTVPGVVGPARILSAPLGSPHSDRVVVVGITMSDRVDALHQLTVFLAAGGPLAILLASGAGWLVAGIALRPVERMRREAAAVSASGLDRRLPVPSANDEIRRLAETLNDMLGRLGEAMQAERRLLDNASHELRTPLTALKAELELARSRTRTPQELRAAIDSAAEEVDRLTRLAEDLLVLARARRGALPVHRQPVSLAGLLHASAKGVGARSEGLGIHLTVATEDVPVFVDRLRVRQAIDNLLDNSSRLSPAGGVIELRARVDGETVTISVTDRGPGFSKPQLQAILESSGRTASIDTEMTGHGLGLAIVRAVAVAHGGDLYAENLAGPGARVSFTLINTRTA